MIFPSEATTYAEWVAAVKALGGRVANMPNTTTPAGAYDPAIWVSKVNAREWAQPDGYSLNGKTAYYRAPDVVIRTAVAFTQATAAEAARGAEILSKDWYDKLEALLGKTGLIVAGGVVVMWLLSRRK